MPHLNEIILILIIMMVVFGVGRLPQIARAVGRAYSKGAGARSPAPPLDITPPEERQRVVGDRKPGAFEHRVEDAEVERPPAP